MESAQIRARLDRQYVVLHLGTDADAEAPALRDRLQAIDPNTDVVLDMSETQHCTADGLTALSSIHEYFADAGGSLTLSRPTTAVRETLRRSEYADTLKVRRRER